MPTIESVHTEFHFGVKNGRLCIEAITLNGKEVSISGKLIDINISGNHAIYQSDDDNRYYDIKFDCLIGMKDPNYSPPS